jgi:integrase
VLEGAVEYGYLPANPARGKRRRLKVSPPARSFLNPEQVEALLRAARELDAEERPGGSGRRLPLVAPLALAGLRIGETLNLRWRDVNLATGTLDVADSKTLRGSAASISLPRCASSWPTSGHGRVIRRPT